MRGRGNRLGRLALGVVLLLGIGALLVVAITAGHTSTATGPGSPAPVPVTSSGPGPSATPAMPTGAPAIHVTALGDSVTAGSQCDCTPFPELYGQELSAREGVPVSVANDGVGGSTSSDLRTALAGGNTARDVTTADIVVLTIGANDFASQYDAVTDGTCGGADELDCVRPQLATMTSNLTAIVDRIRALRESQQITILITGYWNVFEDGEVAEEEFTASGRRAADGLTKSVNERIRLVATQTGARYVDLYDPFKRAVGSGNPTVLLAEDGDHPNADGHRVIARRLLAARS